MSNMATVFLAIHNVCNIQSSSIVQFCACAVASLFVVPRCQSVFAIKRHLREKTRSCSGCYTGDEDKKLSNKKHKRSKRNLTSKSEAQRERQAGKILQRVNRSIDKTCAGAAAPVQVITATTNLKSQPFIRGDDPIVKGKVWDDWLEQIEREFRQTALTTTRS